MEIVINNFDPTHYGEKKQIPVVIKFKRKFTNNNYYYFVVFPDGKEMYMPLDRLEYLSISKIDTRKIKTI
jgi:hypothetical protein